MLGEQFLDDQYVLPQKVALFRPHTNAAEYQAEIVVLHNPAKVLPKTLYQQGHDFDRRKQAYEH
jgi:hypothetical protein